MIRLFILLLTLSYLPASLAQNDTADGCCSGMGNIMYCDRSAGLYVCNNGDYSACYCSRHAIMDLQSVQGCCLWQGGVESMDPMGIVHCQDGAVSEVCSILDAPKPVSSW
jgi:hypothetical protein